MIVCYSFFLLCCLVNVVSQNNQVKSCSALDVSYLACKYVKSCVYGNKTTGVCKVVDPTAQCSGERNFSVETRCFYCYQLPKNKYTCEPRSLCRSNASPPERITINCTVNPREHCFGYRRFKKSFTCNWTSGTRWSTAFLLSITLGGFGADRFYLGHWEEGLGKFFSFGGLGVWTLVDIVLVGIGYITPKDGSLYIF